MIGTVLAFGLKEEELRMLAELCQRIGLEVTAVPTEDYDNPLGALIGLIPKQPPKEQEPLPGTMLVFCFVPDPILDYVLAHLRTVGIAPGSYKAILTENNVAWTVPELFAELQREREELGDYN